MNFVSILPTLAYWYGSRGKLTAINLQRTGRTAVMIAFIVTPTIHNFPNGFFVVAIELERKKDSRAATNVTVRVSAARRLD